MPATIATAAPLAPGFFTPWRAFTEFVRRPQWLCPAGLLAPGAWGWLSSLLLLNLSGLLVLMPLIGLWQHWMQLPGPDAFGKFPREWLALTVVVVAPIAEEALFRGWLSGRPRALWLLGLAVAGVAAVAALGSRHPYLGALLLGLIVLAGLGWIVLRRRPAPVDWLRRHFAPLFYLVALLFGAMHLFNYPEPGFKVVVMVLPQLWSGLVLGFTRMRLGLAGAILVHMASNGLALSLAFAQGA